MNKVTICEPEGTPMFSTVFIVQAVGTRRGPDDKDVSPRELPDAIAFGSGGESLSELSLKQN